MKPAIVRSGGAGHLERLAASLMVATALLIGGLYHGLGWSVFVKSRLAWVAIAPVAGLWLWLAWTALAPRRRDHQLLDLARGLIAWVVALILIRYSLAKVFGSQFGPPLQSELDTPLRDLSGFQLTWRFFGYHYGYALFVAAGQLGAAILMCFGRTRLLGACLQAPIMANIVVLNVTHGIPVKLLSSILLVLDLYLIAALGGRRLLAFFLGDDVGPRPRGPFRWKLTAFAALLLCGYVAYAGAHYHGAVQRRYQPSPIHGTWEVVEVTRGQAVSDWQRMYFENYLHRGKHIGSARTRDGLVWFRYTVDPEEQTIRLELPMRRLEGRLERRDRSMTIRGTLGDRAIAIELERVH